MLGAIFGDIVGSAYEYNNTKDYDFPLLTKWSRPTDDSYMTLAVARALLETEGQDDAAVQAEVVRSMQEIGRRYPRAGYGGRFSQWLRLRDPAPYFSYGNGSGMRVSAAGWLYPTLDETLRAARLTAAVTHNHPEGIKGAEAIAAAVYLARTGADKAAIRTFITERFHYDLSRTLDQIRPTYRFYVDCMRSVPEAIIAFLESTSFEDAIRKAVSLGGDSDTIGCMTGAIAEAYYGMPENFQRAVIDYLDGSLQKITLAFYERLARENRA